MNLGLVQNVCRKAVVVGAKCADRYRDSIRTALESENPIKALRPIEDLVLHTMQAKIASLIQGDLTEEQGHYRIQSGNDVFLLIPLLNPYNARLKSRSVGAVCTYHNESKHPGSTPEVAAAFLGREIGVMHGRRGEHVLRANYRILRKHLVREPSQLVNFKVGVGTEEDWQAVPLGIKQILMDANQRPVIGSPLRVLCALAKGQLDSAVFHTTNPLLREVVAFFLYQAKVEQHEVELDGQHIPVHGAVLPVSDPAVELAS